MQAQAQPSGNTLNVRRLDLVLPHLRAASFLDIPRRLGWVLRPIVRYPHHLSWLGKMGFFPGAMLLIHL